MAKFKVGDKVKIIKRKKNNRSGTQPGWEKPNGNVGEIGYIEQINKDNSYRVQKTMTSGYFGWFDEDDLELVSEEVSTSPYVKGKWYGCEHWIGEHNYIKLNYVSDEQAYFTECINNEKHQVKQDWWSIVRSKLFEADMSVVSQFLPKGHPDKIDSKEFVLPEKWCIKLTEENVDILGKWRTDGILRDPKFAKEGWYLHTPMNGKKGYNEPSKDPDYTEITFEQFKQHVLKESPVVKTPKEENYVGRTIKALVNSPDGTGVKKGEQIKIIDIELGRYKLDKTKAGDEGMVTEKPLSLSKWELISENNIDMKAIQEEAKRRFPIGCKFIPVDSDKTHTLIEDEYTYEIHGKYIWAHNGYGHLYEDGKWATLVSLPSSVSQSEKTYFQKGDYIVTLIDHGDCGKVNYCSKQKEDLSYLKPEIDTKGSLFNGNSIFHITDKSFTKWRYATPEEAAEYERIGKPYDVTTLQKKKEESIPEYVVCVRGLRHATVGKIYKVIDNTRCESDTKNYTYSWNTPEYKPSTKKAYEAQFKQKKLKKEDLVEGEIYIYDGLHISIYPEGPSLSIKEKIYDSNPNWLWTLSITHATEEQKALLRSEIEKNNIKTSISEEYVPQVGDYVVMEKAGGWGYSPHNDGCIAIVEKVSTRQLPFGLKLSLVICIDGQVINPKKLSDVVFNNVPIVGYNKERIFRKALPHEIPNDLPKKTVIEEWEPGTYAVGVKGNFGVYTDHRQLIPIGHIYTIKENRIQDLVVEESEFWIYKENLKWFATREEAETFSKGLRTGHITIESCEKSKPIVSQLWMSDPIVEEKIQTPSIKKETFIENVQSINVMLRTKKKLIKF